LNGGGKKVGVRNLHHREKEKRERLPDHRRASGKREKNTSHAFPIGRLGEGKLAEEAQVRSTKKKKKKKKTAGTRHSDDEKRSSLFCTGNKWERDFLHKGKKLPLQPLYPGKEEEFKREIGLLTLFYRAESFLYVD